MSRDNRLKVSRWLNFDQNETRVSIIDSLFYGFKLSLHSMARCQEHSRFTSLSRTNQQILSGNKFSSTDAYRENYERNTG